MTERGARSCDEEIEIESRVFGIPVRRRNPKPPKGGANLDGENADHPLSGADSGMVRLQGALVGVVVAMASNPS